MSKGNRNREQRARNIAADAARDQNLAAAREHITNVANMPSPPEWVKDQTLAAYDEATRHLQAIAPEQPQDLGGIGLPGDLMQQAVAAVLGMPTCRPCPHLREPSLPPTPGHILLGIGIVACLPCMEEAAPSLSVVGPMLEKEQGTEDRCDWCGRHGIKRFHSLSLQLGHVVYSGDVCGDCQTAINRAAAER